MLKNEIKQVYPFALWNSNNNIWISIARTWNMDTEVKDVLVLALFLTWGGVHTDQKWFQWRESLAKTRLISVNPKKHLVYRVNKDDGGITKF